ncbi:MAG: helix-turn-helix transcriptional regulator [Chitinophagaceae bacterium]|nr:helix-turn-helix transcriptional regulator [Chitinophagaceae bacterium]
MRYFRLNVAFMNIGENIKKIREQKGLLQKQLAADVGIPYTSYNKIENGTRDITIEELDKIARYFAMSIDQVVHFDDAAPAEVTIEDKAGFEQINLINQLDEEDKSTVFKIIDTMLTKKKFKDFFQKNIA